jgi:methionine synthase II (cobalamin-independent)
MFGTLLGGLPRPDGANDQLAEVLRVQEEAGLEPLTDGRPDDSDLSGIATRLVGVVRSPSGGLRATRLPQRRAALTVEGWGVAASRTSRAVKQALPGPYSLLRRMDIGRLAPDDVIAALADALRAEAEALATAGCPLVEIEETEVHRIGTDELERTRFREAHWRIAAPPIETHLSLSIVGGSADAAGTETILVAPYASLAVDLIAGPDNWRLVARTPGERGIVAGVIEPQEGSDDRPELPVWAAHYAASTGGRGLARVGLGTAGGLAGLSWPVAATKLRRLGEAAHVAGLPRGEQADALDPRAVDIRTAAMGRHAPRPPGWTPGRGTRRRPGPAR